MIYTPWIIAILEVLIVTLPVLFVVAFVTVAERKTMASMQRRVGPNIVGFYGLLQAFADALKLLLKEYVSPTQANLILFFLGPIITLIFALLGYLVIPFAPGLSLSDFDLGLIYMLAVSSLATYGILLAGWSANSKYAFLGSLRSTAQLISYELILSSALLTVILLTNSLNLTVNIEAQKAVWFMFPLFPIFIIFFIGAVAETNRAPFDLAEAESELVSGFMTEHSAVIFVFFFLAEYASIVLMCILITILFLGGYNLDYYLIGYMTDLIAWNLQDLSYISLEYLHYKFNINLSDYFSNNGSFDSINVESLGIQDYLTNPIRENFIYSFVIAFKTFILIFTFIWVRASFPRIRFDQLMSYCWTVLLPLVFAFILLVPCILYNFASIPVNILYFLKTNNIYLYYLNTYVILFKGRSLSILKRSEFQAHPFHLVSPSPWPLDTSTCLLALTCSGVLTMHGFHNASILFFFALFCLVLCMGLWWRDVISEGTYLGNHTLAVQRGINMGVALFIISEALFFLAIFWAYFHSALSPTVELGAHWPPMGIEAINPFELPLINTVILLSSGFTVTYAHHSLIEGKRTETLNGLVYTCILALIFTFFQAVEYSVSFFNISDGTFGSCFYFGTGFHGLHVMIGTAFLAVGLWRMSAYHLTENHHLGLESAILYWHFVDVVWIFLYISIYYWGS